MSYRVEPGYTVPNVGDRVYLEDGREVIYQGLLNDVMFVLPIFDDEEGERIGKTPINASVLYTSPPTSKISDDVLKLQEEKEALRLEISELKSSKLATAAEMEVRLKQLEQHEALQRLEDFLAGRITHFVVSDYSGVCIKDLDWAKADSEDFYPTRAKGFKLLTLFGKTCGDLNWRLNQYSDGSGDDYEVIPCTSYEEAMEEFTNIITKQIANWRLGLSANIQQIVKNSADVGITIPDDVIEASKESERIYLRKAIENTNVAVNNYKAKLALLEPKVKEA